MNTWPLTLLVSTMLVGCAATGPQQEASADSECRVEPTLTANAATYGRRTPTEFERREAEMNLVNTPYYRRSLEARPETTIERVRRECY